MYYASNSARKGACAEQLRSLSSGRLGPFGRGATPALLLLLFGACANPVAPTGGPPDRTPPAIEAADPTAGSVDVSGQTVRLTFTEYVDQASFARALTITPPLDGRLDLDWSGRTVEITFPEPFRDNTTYILTLDNTLRDDHNVALDQPITFAFSTGPIINRGRLAGRVVDADQDTGVSGFDVYAYAAPDSVPPLPLPERPDYRTQTDQSGQFQFEYLNEQPYFVIALQDRNRNRAPDVLEPFAVPPAPILPADTTAAPVEGRWLVAVLDTLPPEVQRVRSLSDRRFALRFSEPVHLTTRTLDGWMLRDSLQREAVPIETVYTRPDEDREVFVVTPPLRPVSHLLRPAGIADSSGTLVRADTVRFTPGTTADTLALRFLGFAPQAATAQEPQVLSPGAAPGVRFNRPVDAARLQEVVAVTDSAGQVLPFEAKTTDGTTYSLVLTASPPPDQPVRVTVDGRRLGGADTLSTRMFQPLPARELGEISGVVAAEGAGGPLVVELHAAGERLRQAMPDATGRFLFDRLPAGQYRLRAFLDRNENLQWDGGQILPYQPHEPLRWHPDSLRVRPRWETALEDTLRLSTP